MNISIIILSKLNFKIYRLLSVLTNSFLRFGLIFFILFIFSPIEVSASASDNLILNPSSNISLEGWIATTGMEIDHAGDDGIHIFGTQSNLYNYAMVKLINNNLKPDHKYRLEAEIKIEYISDSTNTPLLKVEARNDQGVWLTNYNTNKISNLLGVWQKVKTEFVFHSNGEYASVFVEKGTSENMKAALYVRNVKLYEITEISDIERLTLTDTQISIMENIKNVRPRIMLNNDKIHF